MHTLKARWILVVAGIAVAGTTLLLWSWNTVVDLFGGPVAEFRHAVAALVLLGVARLFVAGGRGHRRRMSDCPRAATDS